MKSPRESKRLSRGPRIPKDYDMPHFTSAQHIGELLDALPSMLSRIDALRAWISDNCGLPERHERLPPPPPLPALPEHHERLPPAPPFDLPEPYTPLDYVPGLMGTADYWRSEVARVAGLHLEDLGDWDIQVIPDLKRVRLYEGEMAHVFDEALSKVRTKRGHHGLSGEMNMLYQTGIIQSILGQAIIEDARSFGALEDDVLDSVEAATASALANVPVIARWLDTKGEHKGHQKSVWEDLSNYA